MDFCTSLLLKKDFLWLLHFCIIGVFTPKISRIVLTYGILVQLASYGYATIVFSIHPEYFMKYAPFLFFRAYGTAAGVAILWKQNVLKSLWEDLALWSPWNGGKDSFARAEKIIQESKVFCGVIVFLLSILGCLYMPPNSSDFDYDLLMYLLKESYASSDVLIVIVVFLLKVSYFPVFYSMLVHPMVMFYGAQHVRIQSFMFFMKVKSLTKDFEGAIEDDSGFFNDLLLIHDEDYQVEMRRRLSYLVARHIQMIKFSQKMVTEMVEPLFVILSAMGMVFGLSLILLVYESKLGAYNNTASTEIWLATLAVLSTILFCCMFISGQAAEDASEHVLLEIVNIKWYTFEKANRITTTIFILNSLKPLRLQFSSTLAINNQLGVKMAKAMYSMISVIITMQLKRAK